MVVEAHGRREIGGQKLLILKLAVSDYRAGNMGTVNMNEVRPAIWL